MVWNWETVAATLAGSDVYVRSGLAATAFIRIPDSTDLALTYHGSRLIVYHKDGTYTLSSCGFETATTKRRLSVFGPAPVVARDGVWFLDIGGDDTILTRFFDGIRVESDGWPVQSFCPEDYDESATEITIDNQIAKEYL